VYYSPGNHDIGMNPDKQSLKKYTERFGKDRFSFHHKGSLFIGFNTSLIKSDMPKEEQKQYKWLQSNLKKGRKSNHIILFCHYPFFIKILMNPKPILISHLLPVKSICLFSMPIMLPPFFPAIITIMH
jgi:3',5'-cyclic AMP phosphodiesterase CpdA